MWLLIAINAAVFLWELSIPRAALEQVVFLFGLVPARWTDPAWAASVGLPAGGIAPWLTSMFLHGGLLHLAGNMWTLWIFGDNVEDRMGPLRFLVFYLLCGLAASIAHTFSHPDSMLPTVGASGAIAGVMGAYFLVYPLARVVTLIPLFFWPLFVEIPAFFFLLYWLLLQILSGAYGSLSGLPEGGVAWWAHVGGFLAGLVLVKVFLDRRRHRPRPAGDHYGWTVRTRR